MIGFDGIRLTLELEAQMPMIHFQSHQCGVTIRATEVKPKLDHFLLTMLQKETGRNPENLRTDKTYRLLFVDPDLHDALDYKMQISVADAPFEVNLNPDCKENSDLKKVNYSIYYGNMGADDESKKFGVFSNPTLTIICFKEALRKYIEKYLIQFFLVTNFGTMQNKGFGSFVPKGWIPKNGMNTQKKQEVASAFRQLIPNGRCYCMSFGEPNEVQSLWEKRNEECAKMAENIKAFYSVMKTGANLPGGYARSYIYVYGHEVLELGNEKAWMKKQGIAPTLSKPENQKKHIYGSQEQRYLRAFLGIGENISYGKEYNEKGVINKKKGTTVEVNIKSKSGDFERVNSPIYFKVIGNVVFIVAFDVPSELYGAEFTFTGDKGKKGIISVPTKKELPEGKCFDMQDFLARYVKYFNEDLRNAIPRYRKLKEVEEVIMNA